MTTAVMWVSEAGLQGLEAVAQIFLWTRGQVLT